LVVTIQVHRRDVSLFSGLFTTFGGVEVSSFDIHSEHVFSVVQMIPSNNCEQMKRGFEEQEVDCSMT
jgi:hypothetical protein